MDIYLREATAEDGKLLVRWRKDQKTKSHLFDQTDVTIEAQELFFEDKVTTGKYKLYIVDKVVENYPAAYSIAAVYLKNIDLENHRCELGLFVREDEEWNDKAKQLAIKMLIKKAFNEFDIYKIYSYVFSDCEDEANLLEKVGFVSEGVFKDEVYRDGKTRDVIRYGIRKYRE